MRILWFTNIPFPAAARRAGFEPVSSGGWMLGLVDALGSRPEIELGVAFISPIHFEPFEEAGVVYYGIDPPSARRGVPGIIQNWQHPVDFPTALQQCVEVVRQFRPDVIHVHGSEGFFGLIQEQIPVPVVISLQGILTVYQRFYFCDLHARGMLTDVLSTEFLKGRGLVHTFWKMQRAAERERCILRSSRFVIGRTAWDRACAALLNPTARYYHADEIMRASFYGEKWSPPAAKPPIVYCTSSASPYKGIGCLLEAIALLRQVGMEIQLRIGGNFENTPLWPRMQSRVQQLQLSDAVVWLGSVDSETIVSQLMMASVYVLPSYIENSPNSLCEAMLVGTPCVASAVGGVPSLVTDGESGLLFPAGDPYALAGKIQQVLTDPALAPRLTERAHQIAIQRHDPQKIAADMIDIYREVILGNRQEAV